MMKFVVAAAVLLLLSADAHAGRRCGRFGYTYQYTLSNSYCWPSAGGCWSCHPRKTQPAAYNWRSGIIAIQKQKLETEEFLRALQTISPQQPTVPYGQVSPYGYAQPYGSQTYGELSSYPVGGGNTLYGASAYLTPPSVNVDATAQTLLQLSSQMNNGASQVAVETKGLVESTSAAQERVQTRAMAIQALMELSKPTPSTQQNLRWQSYQGPVQPQPAPVQPQQPSPIQPQPNPAQGSAPQQPSPLHQAVATIFNNDCVQCHSPQGKWGVQGTFDITGLTQQMLADAAVRASLPEDDPKRMPKTKTADGFGPGRVLSSEEIRAIQDLSLGVQQ